jgi:hypothetical protein
VSPPRSCQREKLDVYIVNRFINSFQVGSLPERVPHCLSFLVAAGKYGPVTTTSTVHVFYLSLSVSLSLTCLHEPIVIENVAWWVASKVQREKVRKSAVERARLICSDRISR